MARTRPTAIAALLAIFIFSCYLLFPPRSSPSRPPPPPAAATRRPTESSATNHRHPHGDPREHDDSSPEVPVIDEVLDSTPIMPKLNNETLKANLGRATWLLLHTTLSHFPTHPTPPERAALAQYVSLMTKMYPCGECARHFQTVIEKFPVQTSGRGAASLWGCHVHNVVNERLGKPLFECAGVEGAYGCGCAEGEKGKEKVEGKGEEEEEGEGGGTLEEKVKKVEDKGRKIEIVSDGVMNGG